MTSNKNNINLGAMLRQQRLMVALTLHRLATISGVSSSHLRQKIEPALTLPQYIITEPGVGYSFQKTN
jgi:DNA-binding response OmpR family regulator